MKELENVHLCECACMCFMCMHVSLGELKDNERAQEKK